MSTIKFVASQAHCINQYKKRTKGLLYRDAHYSTWHH